MRKIIKTSFYFWQPYVASIGLASAALPHGLYWPHFTWLFLLLSSKISNKLIFCALIFGAVTLVYLPLLAINRELEWVSMAINLGVLGLSISSALGLAIVIRMNPLAEELVLRTMMVTTTTITVLAILAIPTDLWHLFWVYDAAGKYLRLKGLFLEPSHFAFYTGLQLIWALHSRKLMSLSKYQVAIAGISLLLSFSLGVFVTLFLSLITIIFNRKTWRILMGSLFVTIGLLLIANSLVEIDFLGRVSNIGSDHSGKVRTQYSILAALDMVRAESATWGVGPGQGKYIAEKYTSMYPGYVDRGFPSSISSTVAAIGVYLTAAKCILLIIGFLVARGFRNPVSVCLFSYVFIYQFVGGYFNNAYEFIGYALAFSVGKAVVGVKRGGVAVAITTEKLAST